MPLLLLGLDDTLIDRIGAFREWGVQFLEALGAPRYDLDWLLSVDADGMTSTWDLAEAIRDRYRLQASSLDLVEAIREGVLEHIRVDPLIGCTLTIAAEAGFVPVVVTNGQSAMQRQKLRRTGLDRYLADYVISEDVGVRKPNPRIFAIAADRVRMRLADAWLIGDSPEADIEGAASLGIRSVWMHRGRVWDDDRYAPTVIADGVIGAVAQLLAAVR